MNKSLDELKEEIHPQDLHFLCSDTSCAAHRSWNLGFAACQSLTIDRREVKELVEALDYILKCMPTYEDGTYDKINSPQFVFGKDALEAFFAKHPEMKEGE